MLIWKNYYSKNSDKEKYLYNGYGITFDSTGSCSFDNDSVRNVIIFGVDNSSSSHADNCKNNFLILHNGPTFGKFGSPEKGLALILVKKRKKFYLSLHYR